MAEREDFDFIEGDEEGNLETGEPDSVANEEDGQSEEQQQREEKPFNLFENPDFKAFQSAKDREIADLRKQFQRDAEERERLLLSRMNDKEKQEHNAQKLARENQDLKARLDETETLAYRAQRIADLRAETGAPLEAIDLTSEAAAIRSAYKWKLDNSRGQAGEEPGRKRRVDLGSGQTRSATKADKAREQYKAALKENDAMLAMRIADAAERAGINLHGD